MKPDIPADWLLGGGEATRFHQLDLRHEFLRVRNPQWQQQLLVSLVATGQSTPIIVVAVADERHRYLVVDG